MPSNTVPTQADEMLLLSAQNILDGILQAPPELFNARQLVAMLTQESWEPLLERLKINSGKKAVAAKAAAEHVAQAPSEPAKSEESQPAQEAAAAPAPKRRGRPPGKKNAVKTEEAAPKRRGRPPGKKAAKPESDKIPDKNKATVSKGKKRSITRFTPEQRDAQRKVIYQAVVKNPKVITTPMIIATVIEKYPQINDSVVRALVGEMATNGYIKPMQRKGGKTQAVHFVPGSKAL